MPVKPEGRRSWFPSQVPSPPIYDGFLSLFSLLTIRCRPDMVALCTLFLHSTSILPAVAGIYALLNIYTFDAAIHGTRGVNVGCLGRRKQESPRV